MEKYFLCLTLVMGGLWVCAQNKPAESQNRALRIVFIRHGEKPEKGSNLTCKGLNRSLQLPAVITKKFGVPDFIYVPSMKQSEKTTHARMFETVVPLAAK